MRAIQVQALLADEIDAASQAANAALFALNNAILQRESPDAISTLTAEHLKALARWEALIGLTRKLIPLLRLDETPEFRGRGVAYTAEEANAQ